MIFYAFNKKAQVAKTCAFEWLRGQDLNQRPSTRSQRLYISHFAQYITLITSSNLPLSTKKQPCGCLVVAGTGFEPVTFGL